MNAICILEKSERLRGVLLLLITAVLWSTSGIGIKSIEWNPMAIAGVRSAVATIVFLVVFRKSAWVWNRAVFFGAISYTFMIFTFVIATKLTTAANAILLQYTSPVYTAILGAIFLHEKPRFYDWLTIGLVSSGMFFFFQDQMSPGNMMGNFLAIASGVATAVMAVSLRSQKDGSPFESIILGNILTFFCSLPFMFDGSPGTTGWMVLIVLGCFQLGLSFVLYSIAIKSVTALESAIVTMIEPVLNPLWVFLLLGEQPGFWAIFGGVIIITGITVRYIVPVLKMIKNTERGVSG